MTATEAVAGVVVIAAVAVAVMIKMFRRPKEKRPDENDHPMGGAST